MAVSITLEEAASGHQNRMQPQPPHYSVTTSCPTYPRASTKAEGQSSLALIEATFPSTRMHLVLPFLHQTWSLIPRIVALTCPCIERQCEGLQSMMRKGGGNGSGAGRSGRGRGRSSRGKGSNGNSAKRRSREVSMLEQILETKPAMPATLGLQRSLSESMGMDNMAHGAVRIAVQ